MISWVLFLGPSLAMKDGHSQIFFKTFFLCFLKPLQFSLVFLFLVSFCFFSMAMLFSLLVYCLSCSLMYHDFFHGFSSSGFNGSMVSLCVFFFSMGLMVRKLGRSK